MKDTNTTPISKAKAARQEGEAYLCAEEEAAIAALDAGRLTHLFLVRAESAGWGIQDKGFQETLRKVAEYRIATEALEQQASAAAAYRQAREAWRASRSPEALEALHACREELIYANCQVA